MINVVPQGAGTLDLVLSNFFQGYQVPGGIADLIAPRVGVGQQNARYLIVNTDDGLAVPAQTLRAPGAPAQEVGLSAPSYASVFMPSRALKTPIADEDRLAYRLGDLQLNAQNVNAQRIMTEREVRVAALFQNPAYYGVANTLALTGNAKFSSANCDPVNYVEAAKTQLGLYAAPNTAIVPRDTFQALRTNVNLRNRYTGVQAVGALNEDQLASVLGLGKVIIADSVQSVGGVRTRIWSNTMWIGYLDSTASGFSCIDPSTGVSSLSPLDSSFAKTFIWQGGPQTINGYGVMTWRDPDLSRKTNWVSNDCYMQEVVTGNAAGFLFTGAVN